MLQDAVERIFVQNLYADIPRGVYLVRGENVLVLGEIVCIPHNDAAMCREAYEPSTGTLSGS